MGEREHRLARNEATFREANEDLREKWHELELARVQETMFICECGDPTCTRLIRLSLADYEAVREDGNRFAIFPGHDDKETERVVTEEVVEKNDRFAVVRKREQYRSETEPGNPRT